MEEVRLGSRTLQPNRELLADGHHLHVGKRAVDIISVLAEANGAIVTKDELLAAVWPGVIVEENALQVHIVALRKALGPEADRLKTIRGVGYQLALDPENERTRCVAQSAPPTTPTITGVEPPTSPKMVRLQSRPGRRARAWRHLPQVRPLGIAAVLLTTMLSLWWFAGEKIGLRAADRIPLVVRQLTASGTGDRTEAALASGITDELIFRLRRIPELKVATA